MQNYQLILPLYINDSVYMESRGEVLQYVITSIYIDGHGLLFNAYCDAEMHKISFPKEWIGERVFLNKSDAELDVKNMKQRRGGR